MANYKLPTLIYNLIYAVMNTRFKYNTGKLSVDEWQIENVVPIPTNNGAEWTFDVRVALKDGDNRFLDDTAFYTLLKDSFAIKGYQYPDDIENNRREVVYSLMQAI